MANNTLKTLLDFARTQGRVVVEGWGDSTLMFDGNGHSAESFKALCNGGYCAGTMLPMNYQIGASGNNVTMGMLMARRRANGATQHGVVRASDGAGSTGYPRAEKVYGYGFSPSTASNWTAPLPAYLGKTTLSSAITVTDTSGNINLTDGSVLPAAGEIVVDTEVILYLARVGNVIASGANQTRQRWNGTNGFGPAATHLNGAAVYGGDNGGSNLAWSLANDHPLNLSHELRAAVFYYSTNNSVVATSNYRAGVISFPYDIGPLAAATTLSADGGFTSTTKTLNPGSAAAGTLLFEYDTINVQDRGATCINGIVCAHVAGASANGYGPYGPAVLLYQGLFSAVRPYGFIQTMGLSQGGKVLTDCLIDNRSYDSTASTIEFDNAITTKYRIAEKCADANLGGGGEFGYCFVNAWGHNETASAAQRSGIPDASRTWTVQNTTTISGAINDSVTTINVASVSGLDSNGGIALIDSEYITYTTTATSPNRLTGVVRGVMGSVAASHSDGATIRFGYPQYHPQGFASNLIFDYNIKKTLWAAAGYQSSRFWYIWVRPIPTSATATFIADTSPQTTQAQREYKFRRFTEAVNAFVVPACDGFIVADLSLVMTGAEQVNYQYGTYDAGIPAYDYIHTSKAGMELAWSRYVAYCLYGPLSGNIVPMNGRPRFWFQ